MNFVLDGLLALLIFFLGLSFLATRGSTGPEGPVGAWLLGILPFLLSAAILVLACSRGLFDGLGVTRPLQYAASLGIPLALVLLMFLPLSDKSAPVALLSLVGQAAIISGFIIAVHGGAWAAQPGGRWTLTALLGTASLAGWGLVAFGIVQFTVGEYQSALRDVQEIQDREAHYEAEEVVEYRALPPDVPLGRLLRYTWSRNEAIARECRARVAARPDLDEELIRLLGETGSFYLDNAVTYVAIVYEHPPARLAAAWAAMLDEQLASWQTRLLNDDYAGKWEPNLQSYFEGARKLQAAGGDLRPALRRWHGLLVQCKGLGGLARVVADLL